MGVPGAVLWTAALAVAFAALPSLPGGAAGPMLLGLTAASVFAEELIFRGPWFDRLVGRVGVVAGTALSSFCFALIHGPDAGMAFAYGVFLGLLKVQAGTLAVPAAAHLIHNVAVKTTRDHCASGCFGVPPGFGDRILGVMGLVELAMALAVAVALWRRRAAEPASIIAATDDHADVPHP